MSDQLDRPARPARRPRPAEDATVDPIDYRPATAQPEQAPAPAAPAAAATAPRGGVAPSAPGPAARDVTVQLASRISIDVAAVFDSAAAGFPTKRAALEHAILTAFASGVSR